MTINSSFIMFFTLIFSDNFLRPDQIVTKHSFVSNSFVSTIVHVIP